MATAIGRIRVTLLPVTLTVTGDVLRGCRLRKLYPSRFKRIPVL